MNACPKPERIRSKALTDSARGKECTLRYGQPCEPETVVFCHVRMSSGIGTKPPDFWGFYGCRPCHAVQEAGEAWPPDLLRAILETQTLMAQEGLLTVKGWTPR